MSKSTNIKHPRSYQKACERRSQNYTRALNIVKKRIINHIDNKLFKIMGAKSQTELVWILATEGSITARLRLPRKEPIAHFTLVSDALKALVQDNTLQYHDDGDDVVVGIPNTWPPHELRHDIVTVEELDPEFDWTSVADTRCAPEIWRELMTAH